MHRIEPGKRKRSLYRDEPDTMRNNAPPMEIASSMTPIASFVRW
jgi:hypothetical protein